MDFTSAVTWLKAGSALRQAAALHSYHGQANTCRICVGNVWWRCRPRGARSGQKSDRSHMNVVGVALRASHGAALWAQQIKLPPTVADMFYAGRGLWRAAPGLGDIL